MRYQQQLSSAHVVYTCMVSINVSKALRKEAADNLAARHNATASLQTNQLDDMRKNVPTYSQAACAIGTGEIQGLEYMPGFVSVGEQTAVIDAIDVASHGRWIQSSSGRSIANFGGSPSRSSVTEALPPILAVLVERMAACGLLPTSQLPNHCLVNSYVGGAGCSLHQDGPLYEPRVVTLTLGGPAMIGFHTCTADGCTSAHPLITEVILKPGDLLMAANDAYTNYLHGIKESDADVVTQMCCNRQRADVSLGQVIPRATRRLSLVFVRKCNNA